MAKDPKYEVYRAPPGVIKPGGALKDSLDPQEARSYLWVGRILHVDTESMSCSIQLETGTGDRFDVPLPAPAGAGPRSWSGSIPQRGTKVVLGWRRYSDRHFSPYIVQFMTTGVFPAREYEPFSTVDPKEIKEALKLAPELEDDPHVELRTVRVKMRKAYPGDFLASSAEGSDFLLDKSTYLQNRAGNEFILRDSDQTSILQTVNEFVSNSAGYYRRGLIKRSAFNLLPDLALSGFNPAEDSYNDFIEGKLVENEGGFRSIISSIDPDSAAYSKLKEFGLIDKDGTPVEVQGRPMVDLDNPFYPFVVLPDGQRPSYIVQGEHENSFAETDLAYVEDRVELRHVSDGTMAVTEDGDGVQIDPIPPILIEDVRGTVVGNDPYTESGRSQYGRILAMKVFNDPEQMSPSPGPIFEPVDTTTSQSEADERALCRLFKITSPNGVNQYAFGISKEGRVFLHVPAALSGGIHEKGKSIDANIVGLVKTIIGMDPQSKLSLDMRTEGGIKADIGSFVDDADPENPQKVSVDLQFAGKIRTTYAGEQGREVFVGGSDLKSVAGSVLNAAGGNIIDNAGGSRAVEAFSISHNAGFGGLKVKTAGDYNCTVLGKTTELYAQIRQSTFALADIKVMLAGVDSQTVLAGGIARTVAAGTGITDTVGAGNFVATVGTGNMAFTVGTGNMTATVGAGNLALTAGAGVVAITSGTIVSIVAGAVANVTAPIVKIGAAIVGNAVAGVPGPPAPHLDFITGLPLLGIPTVTIG